MLSSSPLAILVDVVLEELALTRSVGITSACCAESDFQLTNVSELRAAFNIRSFVSRTILSLLCAQANTREACWLILEAWDDTAESATRSDTCSHSCCVYTDWTHVVVTSTKRLLAFVREVAVVDVVPLSMSEPCISDCGRYTDAVTSVGTTKIIGTRFVAKSYPTVIFFWLWLSRSR